MYIELDDVYPKFKIISQKWLQVATNIYVYYIYICVCVCNFALYDLALRIDYRSPCVYREFLN